MIIRHLSTILNLMKLIPQHEKFKSVQFTDIVNSTKKKGLTLQVKLKPRTENQKPICKYIGIHILAFKRGRS